MSNHDHDLADEVFPSDQPTHGDTQLLQVPEDAVDHEPAAPAAAHGWSEPQPTEPTWISGPAPTPIIIGLIGLLTLAGAAIWSLTDLTVNWSVAAPVTIVGVGVVIIALGLMGLRRRS